LAGAARGAGDFADAPGTLMVGSGRAGAAGTHVSGGGTCAASRGFGVAGSPTSGLMLSPGYAISNNINSSPLTHNGGTVVGTVG